MESQHNSVLLREAVDALITDPSGLYVDATFGRGGHSREILSRLSASGRLLAFDKDPVAVEIARQLADADSRMEIVHGSFALLESELKRRHLRADGVLMDLGVSSPQLDIAERGFSFSRDGSLDMRMDTTRGITAAQWIAQASEGDMVRIFREYGEERYAGRIAKAIISARAEGRCPQSTGELAALISDAVPTREESKHPATRVFMAIRIFINEELEDLQKTLHSLEGAVKPQGRVVVISFHSLEDRMVKRYFKNLATRSDIPKNLPLTSDLIKPKLKIIGKATKASDGEVQINVRSRSAVMRVAEFCG